MAERFNLTAQINLQAPNTADVANKIRRDLSGLKANVSINADSKALAAVNGQMAKVDKQTQRASKSMGVFNRNLTEAARRFSVITVATGSFIALARAIKGSVGAAIEFERELVRISQVTGESLNQLGGLQKEVTKLSSTLGVANASLLQTSRILAQAGLSASKVKEALDVLARTTLAPSFDNIIDTTEGAIAILNQFGRAAAKTGNDIVFLERSLDAINQVSKSFAVESADLISAIRRTGGVFEAAGGSINELIALFTSVRQTTRESAETIATGFRTIFTRLQRKDTIDALNELGISLQDAEGKFIGPLKAVEALSIGLAGLDPKDIRFNEIVEQLGGFRQIGKVIPLINQYAVATQALAVANNSANSVFKDSETAQQSLSVQFQKTRESFDALIRKFTQSDTFQGLAQDALKIANAFIKFAESLESVLPLLTAIAAIKIGKGLAPGLLGLAGGRRKNAGGKILGLNRGGFVPGSGNRDTVPAMLTPGEFVIRKSSVQSIGAENLARMNENRFNRGSKVKDDKNKIKDSGPLNYRIPETVGQIIPSGTKSKAQPGTTTTTLGNLRKQSGKNFNPSYSDSQRVNISGKVSTLVLEKGGGEGVFSESSIIDPIANYGDSVISRQLASVDKRLKVKSKLAADKNAKDTLAGFAFESFVSGITSVAAGGDKTPFDFVGGESASLARFAQDDPPPRFLDAKRSRASTTKILAKAVNERELSSRAVSLGFANGGLVQRFNTGGAVGGIASQGSAGAAILNPAPTSVKQVAVSGQDVKNTFSQFRGLAKGKDPVSQFYKGRKFKIVKSGLDKSTSDKFKIALEDGLLAGVNFATERLSADLGTPNARIDPGQVSGFVRNINTSIFGRLYETTVDAISRQGNFSGVSNPDKPFDAEAGLPPGLRDNFPDLPPRYIDLKSSIDAASDASMKGKVINQIKEDLISAGILNVDYPGKGKSKEQAKRTSAGTGGFPVKRATGGGISGQDTVPALLTPGEFVFSKPAAQSIGYGKLSSMNTKGVKGFNKGGVVPGTSIQSFANGGGVQRFANGGTVDPAQVIKSELDIQGRESKATARALKTYRTSIEKGYTEQNALNAALKVGLAVKKERDKRLEKNTAQYIKTLDAEKQLEQATRQSAKDRKKRGKGGPDGPASGGGGGGRVSGISGFSKGLDGAGRALDGLSTAALGYTFIVGTLIESSSNLTEEQKRIAQAGQTAAGSVIAMNSQVASLVIQIGSQIAQTVATTGAFKNLEIAANSTANSIAGGGGDGADVDLDVGRKKKKPNLTQKGGIRGAAKSGFAKIGGNAGAAAAALGVFTVATVAQSIAAKEAAEALTRLDIALEKSAETAQNELEKIGQAGQVADEATFVAARGESVAIEQEKTAVAQKGATKQTAAWTFGLAGAGVALVAFAGKAALAGAAAQAFVGPGNIAGAALLAAAGAAIAIAGAFAVIDRSYKNNAKERKRATDIAISLSNDFARTQFRAAQASNNLSTALQKASDAGLDTAGQIQSLAMAFDQGRATFEAGQTRLGGTAERQQQLTEKLQKRGILRETNAGKIVTNEGELEGASEGTKDLFNQFKELGDQQKQAAQEQQKLISGLTAQANVFRNLAGKAVGEAVNALEGLGPAALASVTSIDDVRAKFPELTDAADIAISKFKEAKELEFDAKISQARKAAEAALAAGNKDLMFANMGLMQVLEKRKNAEIALAESQLAVQQQQTIVAQQKLTLATLQAEQAERAKALILLKTNKYLGAFNTFLLQSNKSLANFQEIDDAAGRTFGGGGTFGATQIDTSLFDLPFEQLNDKAIKSITQLGQGVLKGSKDSERDAKQFADNITGVKNITSALPQIFDQFRIEGAEGGRGLPAAVTDLTDQILGAAGTNVSPEIAEIIKNRVVDAIGEQRTAGRLTTEDQQKLTEELQKQIEGQIAVFKAGVELQNVYLTKLNSINNAIINAKQREVDASTRVIEAQVRGAQRAREMFGTEPLSQDAKRERRELEQQERDAVAQTRLGEFGFDPQTNLTGAIAGDVNSVTQEFDRLNQQAIADRKEAERLAREQVSGADAKDIGATADKIAALNKSAGEASEGAKRMKQELERLADQSARAASIQADLNSLRGRQAQVQDLQERIGFGSDAERSQISIDLKAMRAAISQGGNLQGFSEEQRAAAGRGFDLLSDQLFEFEGQELTGKQLKQIVGARATGALEGGEDIQAYLERLQAAEQPLQAELNNLTKQELEAAQALQNIAAQEVAYLQLIAQNTGTDFDAELNQMLADVGKGTPEERSLQDIQDKNAKDIQNIGISLANSTTELSNLAASAKLASEALQKIEKEEAARQRDIQDSAITPAMGGYIGSKTLYRNQGGSIFQPQGTDTVPAMLTPGAFVIRKSAVNKVGVNNLTALNGGRANVVYRQDGGSISGQSSVPAMLTPGEFVMNPDAVKKHGVGYMRHLNRGHAPGFRRGGLIGRGIGSAARGQGGMLMIDPGPLQQVFSEFNAVFSGSLDNIIVTFSSVANSIDRLSASISQGMVVNHQFSGDMTLAFNIQNGDVLKNQIAEAISPKISQMVSEAIDARLNPNDFRSG